MLRKSCPFLALSVALAGGTDSPAPNPLDTIRAGTYSHSWNSRRNARLLNWNINRVKHFAGLLAAIRETKPVLRTFQEVGLGARRTQGMEFAEELAKATGMNYAFAPEFE